MKFQKILLTLAMLNALIAAIPFASETDNPPTLTLGYFGESDHINAGEEVTVPIIYSGPTLRFSSLNLRFAYNKNTLLIRNIVWGPMFPNVPTSPTHDQISLLDSALEGGLDSHVQLMALSKIGVTSITDEEMFEIRDGETLLSMEIRLSSDRSLYCNLIPLRWFWAECGDNAINSEYGSLHSALVSDLLKNDWIWRTYRKELTNPPTEPPSLSGAPTTCLERDSVSTNARRELRFINGGIWLYCGSIKDLGDVNLNGLSRERSDVQLLGQYITRGESVLPTNPLNKLSVTEINGDGIFGDISDFVYLLRMAFNQQRLAPFEGGLSYQDTVILHHSSVSLKINRQLAALLLVFDGKAKVELIDDALQLTEGQIDGDTHVLVYGHFSDGDKLTLLAPGIVLETEGVLKRTEAVNYDGYKLHTIISH